MGEVSTAVFVANIPLCWPLVRKMLNLDSWAGSRSSGNTDSSTANTHTISPKRSRPWTTSITAMLTSSRGDGIESQLGDRRQDAQGARTDEMEMRDMQPTVTTQLEARVEAKPDVEMVAGGGKSGGNSNTIKKTVGFSQVTT